MKREELRPAEDWQRERTWEADGITVLHAAVTVPQLAETARRARRFNRWYRRIAAAYFAYCEQLLLPEARARCRAALEVSAPWEAEEAELRYVAVCRTETLFSIRLDARERCTAEPELLLRRADTWALDTMLPVPLEEWFPKHAKVRRRLIAFARACVQREGTEHHAGVCRARLRGAFSARNYYPTETGLCFFYPMYALAPEIVSFTVPYDAENGPFPPEKLQR